MKLKFKALILFAVAYNSYALSRYVYNTSPGKVFPIADIDKYHTATVILNFKDKTQSWECMGLIVSSKPNTFTILTSYHCVYESNTTDLKQIALTVSRATTPEAKILQFNIAESIKDNPAEHKAFVANNAAYQKDFIQIPVPTKYINSTIKSIAVTPLETPNMEAVTKLVSCDQKLATFASEIEESTLTNCVKNPNITFSFGRPQNGGWYVIEQNDARSEAIDSLLNSGFAARFLSFGFVNSTTTNFYDNFAGNKPETINGSYGIFHREESMGDYVYSNFIRDGHTIKRTLANLDKNSLPGDSGEAIVSCDNAGIINPNEKGRCYLIGIGSSSLKSSLTHNHKVDIMYALFQNE